MSSALERPVFRAESHGRIDAPAERVFAHLDDHERLAAHMSRRSWRMGWGRMHLHLDERRGRAVGSRIRLEGRIFGVWLALEEVVTQYEPPTRKVWETVGAPRLLVIGRYRMGFAIARGAGAGGTGSALTVFIEYALPHRGASRLLGRFFGHAYARWCVDRMVADAVAALGPAPALAASRAPATSGR